MNLGIYKKMFSRMRIKIALRSIIRHRLRSVLSVGMIAGAVCSIILFHGLADFVISALKEIAAESQYGNMQIAKEKYWNPGKESRKERLFNIKELDFLKDKHPEIVRMSGRLSFYGLTSTGELSVGTKIIGLDLEGEPNFTDFLRITAGTLFSPADGQSATVGHLLAKQMNIKPGDSITVLTNTIDGVMNAMDLTVSGTFSASMDEIDSSVIYIPLSLSQSILDTQDVDMAVVKFNSLPEAEAMTLPINLDLKDKSLVAKSWRELAKLFRQVQMFYLVQNRMIEGILLALMFLGILNAVSMTVVERTGEIGTLRSFGESRSDIIGQFVLESLVLTVTGSIIGTVLAGIIITIISVANIIIEMPGASVPFALKINFLWGSAVYASALALFTAVVATYIPAKRAAYMNIVEALRKNI